MNILKYISSLSFVVIALSVQSHCSAAIMPQDVIDQYAKGNNYKTGNVLAYHNCFGQIIVLKNGEYRRNLDTERNVQTNATKDGTDVIFVKIEDIMGLIAAGSEYLGNDLPYMPNHYRINKNKLTQTENTHIGILPQETLKEVVKKYLDYAN